MQESTSQKNQKPSCRFWIGFGNIPLFTNAFNNLKNSIDKCVSEAEKTKFEFRTLKEAREYWNLIEPTKERYSYIILYDNASKKIVNQYIVINHEFKGSEEYFYKRKMMEYFKFEIKDVRFINSKTVITFK